MNKVLIRLAAGVFMAIGIVGAHGILIDMALLLNERHGGQVAVVAYLCVAFSLVLIAAAALNALVEPWIKD